MQQNDTREKDIRIKQFQTPLVLSDEVLLCSCLSICRLSTSTNQAMPEAIV